MADVSVLSDVSLWCRTEGHWWMWERDTMDASSDTFDRHSTCDRCGHTKSKTISMDSWTVVKRRSGRYPEGYLSTTGRVDKSEVYAEQFARATRTMARR